MNSVKISRYELNKTVFPLWPFHCVKLLCSMKGWTVEFIVRVRAFSEPLSAGLATGSQGIFVELFTLTFRGCQPKARSRLSLWIALPPPFNQRDPCTGSGMALVLVCGWFHRQTFSEPVCWSRGIGTSTESHHSATVYVSISNKILRTTMVVYISSLQVCSRFSLPTLTLILTLTLLWFGVSIEYHLFILPWISQNTPHFP